MFPVFPSEWPGSADSVGDRGASGAIPGATTPCLYTRTHTCDSNQFAVLCLRHPKFVRLSCIAPAGGAAKIPGPTLASGGVV